MGQNASVQASPWSCPVKPPKSIAVLVKAEPTKSHAKEIDNGQLE